ncbi:MAG: hypothetical protein Q4G63_07165 [Bacteroidia bacterium]|nr:hypothetical protein [Bacteroidia bacterium]
MLPDSGKSSSKLVAYCQDERVHMELYSSQSGGGTTTQQLGYLKKKEKEDMVETRNTDCWNSTIDVMVGIGRTGDGSYNPIYERMMKLICLSPFNGGGGGLYVPEPDYSGVIPPYKPPTGGGGGSSGSGSSGNGGSSSGGNSGTGSGTGTGGGSSYTGGNTGGGVPRPPSGGGGRAEAMVALYRVGGILTQTTRVEWIFCQISQNSTFKTSITN